MNILVFDTSADTLAAGIRKSDGTMNIYIERGFKHSETLLPAIGHCLSASSMAMKDIGLIACTRGPGSFTGLRIGIATAKGLSLALGIPWVGIPTLDCIAFGHETQGRTIVPVLDARKNRIYSALYKGGKRQCDYLDVPIVGLLAAVDGEDCVSFVGPDAELFADYVLERPGFFIETDDPMRRLSGMATLAEVCYRDHGAATDDEGPLYLREPEIG
jgi:tRNA threonylcarbamoyladenosine biosynthesis protein TsaB